MDNAWHSALMPVYHTHPACTEGNNIEARHWRPGRGGRRLCRHCARLNAVPLLALMQSRRRTVRRV
jgi:hypothetical protein